MKNVLLLLLSAVFCWILFSDCNGCGTSNVIPETTADSTAQAGVIILGNDTLSGVTNTVPVVVDPATKAGAKDREVTSIVAKEDCCAGIEQIKSCCCDIIAKKYSSALSTNDYAFAAKLKSTDPYFAACKTQIPEFEKEVKSADSLYIGN